MATVGQCSYVEQVSFSMKVVVATWTSDASGAVSGFFTTSTFSGEVSEMAAVPGTSGSQPTNNYTVSVLDSNGLDILVSSASSNASNATTSYYKRPLGAIGNDRLQLVISGAGASKSGVVYVFIR